MKVMAEKYSRAFGELSERTNPQTSLHAERILFFPALASSNGQAHRARLRGLAYGVPSDFEMNFGRYLPSLAGDGDTDPKG
ncbi:MAG TPA: hypothetical protein VMJ11_26810 [Paraburkholderia sp.]|uniref:hypothetical protein n=1 Tax=Paraburkholderia sp. TaxID=1926495 RepID=UPI002CB92108|nr:hypothetical protein [Paraburkholderia sp.]HTR10202.1 hypothetical protein [Paraburkholderia sp.]